MAAGSVGGVVTSDADEARAALAAGDRVVLILAADRPASGPSGVGEPLGVTRVAAVPGRLAVLVGDPRDPVSWTAAAAMEDELGYRSTDTGR